jgi:hypothetical protein
MLETKTKRRPGIPHETLAWIAQQSGGTIEHFLLDRETWVRLSIGGKSFAAPNNTALLIAALSELGGAIDEAL